MCYFEKKKKREKNSAKLSITFRFEVHKLVEKTPLSPH